MADIKTHPFYQEICALMEAKKEKEIDKWEKTKLKQTKKDYSNVSDILLSRYETALDQYANTLKRAYSSYQGTSGPAQKERILRKLVTTDHANLSNVIESLNSARTQNRGKTSMPKKKSGWWKHLLAYGTLSAALAGAWFKGDKTQSTPSETDKVPERIENRSDIRTGNTISATQENHINDLRYRYVEAGAEADIEEQERRGLRARLGKSVDVAEARATISSYDRDTNYNEQYQKVDTARSWEDTTQAIKGTVGNLEGTIRNGSGLARALKDFGRATRGK